MTTFYLHHERHPTETTTFRSKERPIRVGAAAVRMVLGHVAPSRVVEPPGTNVGRAPSPGAGVSIDGAGGERPRHAASSGRG